MLESDRCPNCGSDVSVESNEEGYIVACSDPESDCYLSSFALSDDLYRETELEAVVLWEVSLYEEERKIARREHLAKSGVCMFLVFGLVLIAYIVAQL